MISPPPADSNHQHVAVGSCRQATVPTEIGTQIPLFGGLSPTATPRPPKAYRAAIHCRSKHTERAEGRNGRVGAQLVP